MPVSKIRSNLQIIAYSLMNCHRASVVIDLEAHLHATIGWLLKAQAIHTDGGIAASYKILPSKWTGSYPETTGYTIPTLLDYAKKYNRGDILAAALRMAEYELSVQLPDGGYPGFSEDLSVNIQPVAFDTGQVLFGLVAIYQETRQERFLAAAIQAANWLLETQSPQGYWQDYQVNGSLRAIDSRVAWALLCLYEIVQDIKYKNAACNQLDWVIKQQLPNGWFSKCSFRPDKDPVTHTIAYVIEGLLEAGLILNDDRYFSAANLSADALLARMQSSGNLPGKFNRDWHPTARWNCLTGSAQMANIWVRLGRVTGSQKYYQACEQSLLYIAATQYLNGASVEIRGGVAGSWPIYGEYMRFKYPNWAANFFARGILSFFN